MKLYMEKKRTVEKNTREILILMFLAKVHPWPI